MRKILLCSLLCVLLSGCAEPVFLPGAAVKPDISILHQIQSKKFAKGLSVGEVKSAKIPVVIVYDNQVYHISSETFREAINSSLMTTNLYGGPKSKYFIDVDVQPMDLPLFALNYTTTSTIHYEIKDAKNGKSVYDEKVSVPCTVKFFEELNAQNRLQKVTVCAIKENITHFLRTISN